MNCFFLSVEFVVQKEYGLWGCTMNILIRLWIKVSPSKRAKLLFFLTVLLDIHIKSVYKMHKGERLSTCYSSPSHHILKCLAWFKPVTWSQEPGYCMKVASTCMEVCYEGSLQASIPSTVRKTHRKIHWKTGFQTQVIAFKYSNDLPGIRGRTYVCVHVQHRNLWRHLPRPSPAPFSWPHTWPLNRLEKAVQRSRMRSRERSERRLETRLHFHHCKKGFDILFLTRIATVDMVLWNDSQQYSAHGVATGRTEYATRAGKFT